MGAWLRMNEEIIESCHAELNLLLYQLSPVQYLIAFAKLFT